MRRWSRSVSETGGSLARDGRAVVDVAAPAAAGAEQAGRASAQQLAPGGRPAAHAAPVTNGPGTGSWPCMTRTMDRCWASTVRIEATAARTGAGDSCGIHSR